MATARDQNGRANRRSKWDSPAPTSGSATDAAREAARKLNAMLAAKGKLNTNTTPPLLPPKPKSTAGTNNDSSSNSAEMFSDEVEINDSPRRLLLCKSTVQYEINKYSGATISTKGQYVPASEKANFEGQRPLSLFIQASSADKVQLAVKRIQGILNGDDPLTAPPNQTHSFQTSPSPALPSGMHYVQEKVFVGLDNVPPEFNLKEKIVGPGESFFQHITRETGAKIQLRGRGSGFLEPTSGREAFETLYVYISHNSYAGLAAAKKLVENLIQTVTTTYHEFQMQRSSNTRYSNYDVHRAGPPHHPRMYMSPMPHYGIRPHPNSTPSYPLYPRNQYPPRYNRPQQPPPNHHMHLDPSLPLRVPVLYPNQQPIHEGPRPTMNEQPPPHGGPRLGGPYSSPTMRPPQRYVPMYPPGPRSSPHQEPPPSNNNRTAPLLPAPSEISSEADNKVNELEDRRSPDPPKRRFTEAPAKKVVAFQPPSDSSADKQRSVSSLDQPSIPVNTSAFAQDESHRRTSSPPLMPPPVMLAPTMPAPKVKHNPKKDNTTFLGGFKAPFLPLSASVSTAKKNVQSPAVIAGSKRKHDECEKKSSGFALLGSYDDSSDEDEEQATRRLGINRP